MKKKLLTLLLCAALVCLTGCGAKRPTAAVDGSDWSRDWLTLGQTLGIETPGHDLTLRDNKTARNMFYASWSIGKSQRYTGENGQKGNLYDAQLLVMVTNTSTAEDARSIAAQWQEISTEHYDIIDTAQETYNGQTYTVLTYTFPDGTSPFARGVSAFTVFENRAISAEFACQEGFEEDGGAIVADVLEHCHYASAESNG